MTKTNIAYKIHYTCGKDIKLSYDLIYDNQNLTYQDSKLTYHKNSSETLLHLGFDGDYFEVSGYTTIEQIRSLGVGMQVVLVFESTTTLVHSDYLILPDNKNIHTTPHHSYRFIEYEYGKWKMLLSDIVSSTHDLSAVHVDTMNEINQITLKNSATLNDVFILEDSENDWNKKKFGGYSIARTGKEEKIGSNSDANRSNYIYEDFPEGFILERFSDIGALIIHNIFVMNNTTYVSGYLRGSGNPSFLGYFKSSGVISYHIFSEPETDVLGSFNIVGYDNPSAIVYSIEKSTNKTEKFILKYTDYNSIYERISIGDFTSVNENPSCIIFCENFYNLLVGTDGGRILRGGGDPWNTVYIGEGSIKVREIIKTGAVSFLSLLFDSNTNQCSLLKTNDNGDNWNIIASNLPNLKNICLSFQGYILGFDDKQIYVFKENKDNFSSLLTVTNEILKTISYLGNGIIFATGDDPSISYDLWFSYDFGTTWKHSKINTSYEIIDAAYDNYIDGITLLAQKNSTTQTIFFIPTLEYFYDFGVSFSELENTDKNAIHTDKPSEIIGITAKTNPLGTDIIVIEDSGSSYVPLLYKGLYNLTYSGETLTCINELESWDKKSVALMDINLPGIDSTAYHSNLSGEYTTARQGQKSLPVGADRLIIEDSQNSLIKKFIEINDLPSNNVDETAVHLNSTSPEIGTLPTDSILPQDLLIMEKADGTKRKFAFSSFPTAHDADAIHKTVPNEINLINESTSPDDADYAIIEINDPIDGNRVKKKVKLSNIPNSSGGENNFGINEGGGSIEWYSGKDGSGLKFRSLDIDTSTGLAFTFPGGGNYILNIDKDSLKTYLDLNLNDIDDTSNYKRLTKNQLNTFIAGSSAGVSALAMAGAADAWIIASGKPLKDKVENDLVPKIDHLRSRRIDRIVFQGNGERILDYVQINHELEVKTLTGSDTIEIEQELDESLSFKTKYEDSEEIVFKDNKKKLYFNWNNIKQFPSSTIGNPQTTYYTDTIYGGKPHAYYFWTPSSWIKKMGNAPYNHREVYRSGVFSSAYDKPSVNDVKFRMAFPRYVYTEPGPLQMGNTMRVTSITDFISRKDTVIEDRNLQIIQLIVPADNEIIDQANPQVLRIRHLEQAIEKEDTNQSKYKKTSKFDKAYKGIMIALKVTGIILTIAALLKDESDPEKAYAVYGNPVEVDDDDPGYFVVRNIKPKNVFSGEHVLTSTLTQTGEYEHDTIQLNFDPTKIYRLGMQSANLNMGGHVIYGSFSVPWNYAEYAGAIPSLYDIKNSYPIFIYDKPNQFIPLVPRKLILDPFDLFIIEDSTDSWRKKIVRWIDLKPNKEEIGIPIIPEIPYKDYSQRWCLPEIKTNNFLPKIDKNFVDTVITPIVTTLIFFTSLVVLAKKPMQLLKLKTPPQIYNDFEVYFLSLISGKLNEFTIPSPNSYATNLSFSQSGVIYGISSTTDSEKFITSFFSNNLGVTDRNTSTKNAKKSLKEGFSYDQYSLGTFNYKENPISISWTHENDIVLIGTYVSLEFGEESTFRILRGHTDTWTTVYSETIQGQSAGVTHFSFIDKDKCLCVINEESGRSTFKYSDDNGSTWQDYSSFELASYEKFIYIANDIVIAQQDDKLFRSEDLAQSFSEEPIYWNLNATIKDILYIAVNTLAVCGQTTSGIPFLAISYSNGDAWESKEYNNVDVSSFNSMTYETSTNSIFCCGDCQSEPNKTLTLEFKLPQIEGVIDNMAFHLSNQDEISLLEEKTKLNEGDYLLVESSSDSFKKRKATIGTLSESLDLTFNNKDHLSGFNYPYDFINSSLDDWPYFLLNLEYEYHNYPTQWEMKRFGICPNGNQLLCGVSNENVSSAGYNPLIIYRTPINSTYYHVTFDALLVNDAPGLTNMTITPDGWCYYSLTDSMWTPNLSLYIQHQDYLNDPPQEVTLPSSIYMYYQTALCTVPRQFKSVLVARAVSPNFAPPARVEIFKIYDTTVTKLYDWSPILAEEGFIIIAKFVPISSTKILAVRTNYTLNKTTLLISNYPYDTWTETHSFTDAFEDMSYIGNNRLLAISKTNIYLSYDFGLSWNNVYQTYSSLKEILHVSGGCLMVTGGVDDDHGVILISFDSGINWQSQNEIHYDQFQKNLNQPLYSPFVNPFDKKVYMLSGKNMSNKLFSNDIFVK